MFSEKVSASRDRIFGLDLMRAVAIIAVLGSHILYIFPEQDGWFIPLLHLGGVMGVEIFFVLSGFLIGRILFRLYVNPDFKRVHLGEFIVRRWFRTLPNYYLVLVLNIVLVLAIGRNLPDNLPSYFLFLQNFRKTMDVFFTESWSLPIEEFAYILGPVVLLVLYHAFAKAKKETLFLLSTLLIIVTFIITKVVYNSRISDTSMMQWNEGLKAVTIYRLDAVFYGVLAAYISRTKKQVWKRYAGISFVLGVLLFFGFQFVLGAYVLTPTKAPFLWNVLYLPYNAICFCLMLPILSRWKASSPMINEPITLLSKISYAVYLLHYGLLLQAMRWIYPTEDLSLEGRFIYAGVYLVILMIISYFWYRLYEKPMTGLRDTARIKKLFKYD